MSWHGTRYLANRRHNPLTNLGRRSLTRTRVRTHTQTNTCARAHTLIACTNPTAPKPQRVQCATVSRSFENAMAASYSARVCAALHEREVGCDGGCGCMTLENATAASTTAGSVGLVCTTCDTKYPCVHVVVRARAHAGVCIHHETHAHTCARKRRGRQRSDANERSHLRACTHSSVCTPRCPPLLTNP